MKMILALLACLAFSAIGCSIELPVDSTMESIEAPKTTHTAKPDNCARYQERAMLYLPFPSIDGRFHERTDEIDVRASLSSAYSSYYLVCRNLEKRK